MIRVFNRSGTTQVATLNICKAFYIYFQTSLLRCFYFIPDFLSSFLDVVNQRYLQKFLRFYFQSCVFLIHIDDLSNNVVHIFPIYTDNTILYYQREQASGLDGKLQLVTFDGQNKLNFDSYMVFIAKNASKNLEL